MIHLKTLKPVYAKTVVTFLFIFGTFLISNKIFAQVDSVFWYVNGHKDYWYIQQDVWVFRLINGQQYTSNCDPNVVEKVVYRDGAKQKYNEIHFKDNSIPNQREIEKQKIRADHLFRCELPVINKDRYEINNRIKKNWMVVDQQILVTFIDDNPTNSIINNFKAKWGLILVHTPKRGLIPRGAYVFELINNQCNLNKTSISLSADIYAQDGGSVVKIVDPNIHLNVIISAPDPYFDNLWHITNTGQCVTKGIVSTTGNGTPDADCDIEEAWSLGFSGLGIKVAVIDFVGFDTQHPDMTSKFVNPWNTVNNSTVVAPPAGALESHAQACSGLIAAIKDNGIGIAGVAYNSEIIPIKAGDQASTATSVTISTAFQHARLYADIISCSWLTPGFNATVANEIQLARTTGRGGLGCVIVFAAGNGNTEIDDSNKDNVFPTTLDDVIGVIGSTPDDLINQKGNFWTPICCGGTNYGIFYNVAAPGTHFITADYVGADGWNDGANQTNQCNASLVDADYRLFSGTSAAAPITAGVCALIMEAHPSFTAWNIQNVLQITADKVNAGTGAGQYDYNEISTGFQSNGAATKSLKMGHGRINALVGVSLDPNNKLVGPFGCGSSHFIEPQDTLTYRINFQNIGDAPALLVIIRDTLDNDLDISTLTLLGSKHPFTFQILNGNIAEWTFDPIFLPDSSVSHKDSKGFVKFSILPLQSSIPGTIITNKAGIIFDQNVPVITNEVFNTISTSPPPVASIIEGDQTICEDETVTFTASQGDRYIWNTGETTQSITVEAAGIYKVRVFYENSCQSSATATLAVNPNLSNFEIKRQCNSNVYDFTYTGGLQNISFLWDFGSDASPSTSTDDNPTGVTFSTPGTKQITLTVIGVVSNCTITAKSLDVLDLSCGNNKVVVCHIESGKPDQTICVNSNALPTHLSHGDCIGPCKNTSARIANFNNENVPSSIVQNIFELYPNPFREKTTLNFTVSEDDYVKIEVYNYMGQKLYTLYDNFSEAGQVHSIHFETKGLGEGIYFGVLTTSVERRIVKMSITK